jgi:hypothetical protein
MKRHHLYTLALLLGSIALMGSGIQTWSELTKPAVVFGLIANVAAVLKAMYQGSPNEDA